MYKFALFSPSFSYKFCCPEDIYFTCALDFKYYSSLSVYGLLPDTPLPNNKQDKKVRRIKSIAEILEPFAMVSLFSVI
jgi:hypothetical protein